MKCTSFYPSTFAFLLFASVFIGIGVAHRAHAQNLEKERQKIKMVMADQEKAWNEGDVEKFMEGYWKSDQLRFIGGGGISYGWQTTLDNYKKRYPDKKAMGVLTFDIMDVQVFSDGSAWVLGKWKLQREKDEPKGHFTLLWKKVEGRWVIVCDHTS